MEELNDNKGKEQGSFMDGLIAEAVTLYRAQPFHLVLKVALVGNEIKIEVVQTSAAKD
jgi:hypothetical protein